MKSFSDIVCRVPSDRIDRFLLLGMRRWPYWPCHAAQARDGVELAVLQSYCWMYSTLRIPLEYKGACSGQWWLNIYSRDLYKRCGSDIVLLFLIPDIITFQAATRTRVWTLSCTTRTTSGCHSTSSSWPSCSTCPACSGSAWRAASWSSSARGQQQGAEDHF